MNYQELQDAQAKKVFDVFVGMKDQEKIVTATVLANMEEKAQPVLDNDTNTATYENKVIGYENKIKTYKVTLTKTVTGDAGDMTYKFPFKVKLSSDVTKDDKTTIDGFPVVLATADSTKATVGTTESTIGAVLSDIAIAHGGSVTIDSLPKSAVVSLMETIAAGEGYTITSTVTGTDEGVKNITGTSTHSESGDTYATEGEIKDADINPLRNKRDVWKINTVPFKGGHYAAYPPKLVETCLLAGCPEGGVVLDPFMGSGTTGMVAAQMGRHFVGIELNPAYTELAYKRIGGEI